MIRLALAYNARPDGQDCRLCTSDIDANEKRGIRRHRLRTSGETSTAHSEALTTYLVVFERRKAGGLSSLEVY
jgi:hypothetical protein